MRSFHGAVLALAVLGGAQAAVARPYDIDDLLHQETLGAQAVDPAGRWIVFERRDPYDTARRFDGFLKESAGLTRLYAIDLRGEGRPRPLLARDPGPGETLGRFSPSGERLAIYRIRGVGLTLGVVTVRTGAVRWFDITPEDSDWSPGLQWIDDRELLVIARPHGSAPWTYRDTRVFPERAPRLWAATATGRGGRTVVGSGAYAGLRPRPAPNSLLRLDVVTGRRQVLAKGALFDLEVAPGGRRAALFEAGAEIQAHGDRPVQGEAGISTQETTVSILDLQTGRRDFPCPGRDALPHLLSWSPSGRSLLVYTRKPGELWRAGALTRIDAPAGRAERLAAGLQPWLSLRPETVRTGWMGEDPVVLARPVAAGPEARNDWFRLSASGPVNLTAALPDAPTLLAAVDAQGFTALAGGRIWRVTREGQVLSLAGDRPMAVRPPRTTAGTQRADVAPASGAWVETGPDDHRRLAWLDARGLGPGIHLPPGIEPELAASAPARAALVSRVDDRGVTTASLIRAGKPIRPVAVLNPALADTDPPIVRAVRHRGPDGQPLTSWLLLPPHRAGPPPPLIVQPYSGMSFRTPPRDYPGERGFVTSRRMLLGHGYAVLVPSLPLPRDHHDPIAGLADQIEAVIAAARADPALAGAFDPDRVALWGHSYGGYTAMAAIAQTHRYRAAVSIAGVSDFLGKWAAMLPPWRAAPEEAPHNNWSTGTVEANQEAMEAPPWVDPARYLRNSPLLLANRIETPLLLFHGDQDVVPLAQSEAMYAALYRQGKDAILVTEWGENHMMMNPGNVRDLFARAFAFLDEHLGPRVSLAPAVTPPSPGPAPASAAPTPPPRPPRGSRWRGTPGSG